ncbi:hypothetical protein HN903_01585 [archaeon]|jgi:hypothetical protein|nr:hypothetical protein [archaeon]MBT7128424.1 hypothetical protein [archaeon]
MEVKKYYQKLLGGADYSIGDIQTIGGLRRLLGDIIDDLPEDDKLKIAEIYASKDKICYTLEEPVLDD